MTLFGSNKRKLLFALLSLSISLLLTGLYAWNKYRSPEPGVHQELIQVESTQAIKNDYDVIVAGTDPEGIATALSASRNGLKTLLVDGRGREILGGLMTLGWLNSVDLIHSPDRPFLPWKHSYLNEGIYLEWYEQMEGSSFDVNTAANTFYQMVKKEKNIDLLMKVEDMQPVMTVSQGMKKVVGLRVTRSDGTMQTIKAKVLIDATQDADIAAAAGVPFTIGHEDLGNKSSHMAVTLIFKLKNAGPDVWDKIVKRKGVGADQRSAWGYGNMWNYPSTNKERVRMRGLNIGRQNNHSILINAIQIFGIDPLDPKSRQEAFEIGKKELPSIVAYMKRTFPEFAGVELSGAAPELYVRETRHMVGEYRLSMVDVLDNRDQWDRIAFGSYNVDIQSTSYQDRGTIVSKPLQYAIPFRSIVPLRVDGLLVVGRSASFDSLPFGSARVIPVGMATGEAAGAAAKIAIDEEVTFRQLSQSHDLILKLQNQLNLQGMKLHPFTIKPLDYMKHKDYAGLKAAVSLGLTSGGSENNFSLDEPSNPLRLANQMNGVKKVFPKGFLGDAAAAISGISHPAKAPLSLNQAAYTVTSAIGMEVPLDKAISGLASQELVKQKTIDHIIDKQRLTNGEVFMIIKDVVERLTGTKYD
jgi:ribulose 1,5-bisphosphate synthetase/thiazole synthase